MIKVVKNAFKRDGNFPCVFEQCKVYFLGMLVYKSVKETNTPGMIRKFETMTAGSSPS